MVADNPALMKALHESAAANKDKYNYDKPDPSVLEKFEAPQGDGVMSIKIEAPEFTSLCPITGQPDFATIEVIYHPRQWCVESKSFKLYLMGYRNYGTFHESCTQMICNDLRKLLLPLYIEVNGLFVPRGGISFQPKVTWKY